MVDLTDVTFRFSKRAPSQTIRARKQAPKPYFVHIPGFSLDHSDYVSRPYAYMQWIGLDVSMILVLK